MNVYQNIAQSNPDAAYEVCKNYGYFDIVNLDELSHCLQTIVAQQGEEGLKDVMSLHPDKDVLLELFGKKKDDELVEVVVKDCSCNKENSAATSPAILNATGSGTTNLVNQTNLYILAGAVIVSFAIISMKK